MKKFTQFLLLVIGLGAFSCSQAPSKENSNPTTTNSKETIRIISLSGFLTELLYDLGQGDKIVGRDITSTFPAEVTELPSLGHISQLNAEGILELNPNFIFVQEDQMAQSDIFENLKASGIQIIPIRTSETLSNSERAAKQIAKYLNVSDAEISKIKENILADSLQLAKQLASYDEEPSVLFIYARGAGRLMIGGQKTAVSSMIQKAGGRNAIQSFEGYKALTPESLIEAQPEVILMFSSGLASLDGKEGLEQITGIAQTKAFKENRIIAMDGHYLSSYGPRSGRAAMELASKIHE